MLSTLLLETATICLYRNLLGDEAIRNLIELLAMEDENSGEADEMLEAYCKIYAKLLQEKVPNLNKYVERLIHQDENLFTISCERDVSNKLLREQAYKDIIIMEKLATLRCDIIKEHMKRKISPDAYQLIDSLPDWNSGGNEGFQPAENFEGLVDLYRKNGAGLFSKHMFFVWDGNNQRLAPVRNPDPISLNRLYLVDSQKETVIKNTEMFLAGKDANNILLYGDRGTGKSSMVKAVANAYANVGLRLVEVPKKFLEQIPTITSLLADRGLKFILFIDDLAFENNEEKYTALKAVLEGGLEYKPSNILLYATSNRRHLVKEKFSDRKGINSDNPDEEIRARDSMQEKLSLADRFGITVVFSSPLKKEYLQIVHKMAEEYGVQIDARALELKAMQWEMAYNGMSPRTARQFVYWLRGEVENHKDDAP